MHLLLMEDMSSQLLMYQPNTAISVNFYRKKLHELNSAEFVTMDENQRELLRQDLLNTLLLLRIEAQTHLESGRRQTLTKSVGELNYCLTQLRLLGLTASIHNETSLAQQVAYETNEEHPLQYMAVPIYLDLSKPKEISVDKLIHETNEFINQIQTFHELNKNKTEEQAEEIKKVLSKAIWWRRLWWTYGKNVWLFSLSLVSKTNVKATTGTNELMPVMGCFSWLLFLLRGGIEFSEAIRESLSHKSNILSGIQLEKKSFWSRFYKQLSNRKFILLNDLLSGVASTSVFFAGLNGSWKTELGFIGNMLTLTVLILDTVLAFARFVEAKNKHNKLMARFNEEENELKKALKRYLDGNALYNLCINGVIPSKSKKDESITPAWESYSKFMALVAKLQSLRQARAQELSEWHYKQISLLNNIGLTSGLVIGYTMMSACYLDGLSLIQELTISAMGASIAFLVLLIFNLVNILVERQQHIARAQALETEARFFEGQLLEASDDQKNYLSLKATGCKARSAYEYKLASYHLKCAPIRIMIDSVTPIIFFMSLHFLVMPQAVAIVAISILLILAAKHLMKRWEPVEPTEKIFPKLSNSNLFFSSVGSSPSLPAVEPQNATLQVRAAEDISSLSYA